MRPEVFRVSPRSFRVVQGRKGRGKPQQDSFRSTGAVYSGGQDSAEILWLGRVDGGTPDGAASSTTRTRQPVRAKVSGSGVHVGRAQRGQGRLVRAERGPCGVVYKLGARPRRAARHPLLALHPRFAHRTSCMLLVCKHCAAASACAPHSSRPAVSRVRRPQPFPLRIV